MFVIFSSDGEMGIRDVVRECQGESWCPVLTIQEKDGKTFVPTFSFVDVANRFRKRNTPVEWLTGVVNLTDMDVQTLQLRGFELRHFDYPNRVTGTLGVEVIPFSRKPEVRMCGAKR